MKKICIFKVGKPKINLFGRRLALKSLLPRCFNLKTAEKDLYI